MGKRFPQFKAIVAGASIAGSLLCPILSADVHAEGLDTEWILTKAGEKLDYEIRNAVEEKWQEDLLPDLIESLGGEDFGEKYAGEMLTGLLTGLPGVAFNLFLGATSSGPSEMQVMTEAILTAISESEENIIAAIEDSSDDETRDSLRALTRWWDKYNSSSLWSAQYDGLTQMSYEATDIRTSLEFNDRDKAARTVQLYMLAASLEMQIDMHIHSLLTKAENPNATESDIWQEYMPTFQTFVRQVATYVVSGTGGARDVMRRNESGSWESSYGPVREIITGWWEKAGFPERPLAYIEWQRFAKRHNVATGGVTSDDTGQFWLTFGVNLGGPVTGHSGTIKETFYGLDGSVETRTISIQGSSQRFTRMESGRYEYERVKFCREYLGRYEECQRGGHLTVNVTVDE